MTDLVKASRRNNILADVLANEETITGHEAFIAGIRESPLYERMTEGLSKIILRREIEIARLREENAKLRKELEELG